MSLLYVCDTSSDCISRINLEAFEENCRINLRESENARVGPHGICKYRNKIITANSYSNNISIINLKGEISISHTFIGVHCNDVAAYEGRVYVICGDLNSVIVMDLVSMKMLEVIPCGNEPHSISMNINKKILLVANMKNDSISLIEMKGRKNCINIRVGAYPTKAIFTLDGEFILVCESNIGSDYRGCISILSLKTHKIIYRIPVGNCPTDIYCDEKYLYVSNFGDGTVSIIDINNYQEINKIIVGGMPRGIVSLGKDIYVGDNYNNMLLKVDYTNENKKKIPIGGEPTGMILV